MKQYLDLLQNILDNGVEKESGRANMPNTIGISKADISMDMADGFPLLTTKKMYLKGIIHELIWFLRGDTNIKYLVNNNVNIWNQDAYRWYLKFYETLQEPDYAWMMDDPEKGIVRPFIIDEFVDIVKSSHVGEVPADGSYRLGDLGKVYGYQWRNQNGVDQVKDVIDGLKSNPYSRYHIIDGWNKADFKEMALPPCHLLYQFIVRPLTGAQKQNFATEHLFNPVPIPKFYLDLNMYQRSCDTLLGVPFNIASMSLLLMIFAKASNMLPGVANWIGGDTHIYVDHISVVKEQLQRKPFALPKLHITKDIDTLEDILSLNITDFELYGYCSYDTLKAELFTGLKK